MATERMAVRTFVDSQRPLDSILLLFEDLRSLGYESAEFPIYALTSRKELRDWCEARFKQKHWINFGRTYWFTDEHKATEFRLRWL